jgi:hypothetical protein
MGILGGYLPGSAPLHGEEQRPSGAGGRHWGGDGSEQHGQGSSTQQGRRLVESFQRRAQPVGGDGDDRTGPAPAPRPGRSCSLIWPSRWSSPSSRSGYATTALHGVLVFAGCLAASGGPGTASRSMRIASTPMMSSTGWPSWEPCLLSPGWPPAPATRPGRRPDSSRFCHAAIRMVLVALYLRAYDGRLDGFHGQIRASHAYSLPCSTAIYLGIRTPSRFLLRASTAPLVA